MAKRSKPQSGIYEPRSQMPIEEDDFFGNVVDSVQKRLAKKGQFTGQSQFHVIPMPSLAARYLLQNEGWPLGKIASVSGPPKSYKSVLAMEIGRWHTAVGGRIFRCECESKDNEGLRQSVLHWNEKVIKNVFCTSLEEWQMNINFTTDALQKKFSAEDGPGRTIPVCEIVDSVMGQAALKTIENMDKSGHAQKRFADEAKFIADFMRTYPQKLLDWPFTMVGVNHVKLTTDAQGNQTEYEPGGFSIPYQIAFNIRCRKVGSHELCEDCVRHTISIRTEHNSYGIEKKMIHVPLTFWYVPDAEGIPKLHSQFEWWESDILLLFKGVGFRKDDFAFLEPKIKEIVDLHEKNCGSKGNMYWSNKLGVPSSDPVSMHELGVLLEQSPQVLVDLYRVLGIARHPFFQPGLDYLAQVASNQAAMAESQAKVDRLAIDKQLLREAAGLDAQFQDTESVN